MIDFFFNNIDLCINYLRVAALCRRSLRGYELAGLLGLGKGNSGNLGKGKFGKQPLSNGYTCLF